MKSLFGIVPIDTDMDEAKRERLGSKQMKVLIDANVIVDVLMTSRECGSKRLSEWNGKSIY